MKDESLRRKMTSMDDELHEDFLKLDEEEAAMMKQKSELTGKNKDQQNYISKMNHYNSAQHL